MSAEATGSSFHAELLSRLRLRLPGVYVPDSCCYELAPYVTSDSRYTNVDGILSVRMGERVHRVELYYFNAEMDEARMTLESIEDVNRVMSVVTTAVREIVRILLSPVSDEAALVELRGLIGSVLPSPVRWSPGLSDFSALDSVNCLSRKRIACFRDVARSRFRPKSA